MLRGLDEALAILGIAGRSCAGHAPCIADKVANRLQHMWKGTTKSKRVSAEAIADALEDLSAAKAAV